MGKIVAWMTVGLVSIGAVGAVVGVVDVDGLVGSGEWDGGLLWEKGQGGAQGDGDLIEAFYGLDYGINLYFRLDLNLTTLQENGVYEVLVDLEEVPGDDLEKYDTPAAEYVLLLNMPVGACEGNDDGMLTGDVQVLYYDGAGACGWSQIDWGYWAFGDVLEIGVRKPEGIEKPYFVASAYVATELGSEGMSGSPRCILTPVPEPGTIGLFGVACTMLLGATKRLWNRS